MYTVFKRRKLAKWINLKVGVNNFAYILHFFRNYMIYLWSLTFLSSIYVFKKSLAKVFGLPYYRWSKIKIETCCTHFDGWSVCRLGCMWTVCICMCIAECFPSKHCVSYRVDYFWYFYRSPRFYNSRIFKEIGAQYQHINTSSFHLH